MQEIELEEYLMSREEFSRRLYGIFICTTIKDQYIQSLMDQDEEQQRVVLDQYGKCKSAIQYYLDKYDACTTKDEKDKLINSVSRSILADI